MRLQLTSIILVAVLSACGGGGGGRSGSAYLNRFTPRDKDTAGGLN